LNCFSSNNNGFLSVNNTVIELWIFAEPIQTYLKKRVISVLNSHHHEVTSSLPTADPYLMSGICIFYYEGTRHDVNSRDTNIKRQ
jgi:hypothetical protein